jgi:nucleoside-diphosphate-sugar epimerase
VHVLVTAATGTLGRIVARQLIAAGHTVSGIAEHPHACLDPAVEFVRAPLSDPVLQELADDADAVVHLAPVDPAAPDHVGLDGVAQVAHVAARAGARLLYLSQAAGRPEVYRPAEALVSTSWGPSLVIRIAPPVGRQLDWMVCRTVATVLRAGSSAQPIRVLHLDDLVRFLLLVVDTDRTGVVDLATPDTTNLITAWRLLRSVDPRSRAHRVPRWPRLAPEMDLSAVQEDWRFEFGWRAIDAIADTGRGLVGRRLDAAGAVSHGPDVQLPVEAPPRFEPPDGLRSAAPDGLEGEFDDRIDPRFPIFSAKGLADTLPGPLTPMTLDVQLSGLRMASRVMGQLLVLGGTVADEWWSRSIAVFGHRPYVGVSANVVAAGQLPGWNKHAIAQRAFGESPPATELLPFGQPQLAGGARGSVAKALVAARSVALLRHLRTDTRAYAAAAGAEHLDATQLAALPDAGLEVRIPLLRDRIHQGWILTAMWVIGTGVAAAVLDDTSVSGVDAILQSSRIAEETASLATILRADPLMRALARDGDFVSLRTLSPDGAAALSAALARIGHRGPGEAELANPTFGDDPAMLVLAASKIAHSVDARTQPPASLAHRFAAGARESRELAYDATIRFTHELRMTLRELASRRIAADLIDVVADAYYLTCDELVTMPADARLRIKRRRTERERLQAQGPPDVIDSTWLAECQEAD